MSYIVTSEEMKRCDNYIINKIGVPSMVLMERAALVAIEELMADDLFDLSHVLCVCGAGNNGGDGFAVARLLHLKGVFVEVLFIGSEDKCSSETAQQMRIAKNYGISVTAYRPELALPADVMLPEGVTTIVDALFGIGLARPLEGVYKDVIDACNSRTESDLSKIFSVDIPSGISADTGQIMGTAVKADKTVVLAYQKLGMTVEPGKTYAGNVVVKDIGITDVGFAGVLPAVTGE